MKPGGCRQFHTRRIEGGGFCKEEAALWWQEVGGTFISKSKFRFTKNGKKTILVIVWPSSPWSTQGFRRARAWLVDTQRWRGGEILDQSVRITLIFDQDGRNDQNYFSNASFQVENLALSRLRQAAKKNTSEPDKVLSQTWSFQVTDFGNNYLSRRTMVGDPILFLWSEVLVWGPVLPVEAIGREGFMLSIQFKN